MIESLVVLVILGVSLGMAIAVIWPAERPAVAPFEVFLEATRDSAIRSGRTVCSGSEANRVCFQPDGSVLGWSRPAELVLQLDPITGVR